MRILYASQLIPYPIDAGPKRRIHHVLHYLASAGHEVTFVGFSRETDDFTSEDRLRTTCESVHTVPIVRSRGRDLWHLARSQATGLPFLIARDDVAAMHAMLGDLLSQRSFDALHADQLSMAQYVLAGSPSNARTLVLDQHNAMHLIPQRLADTTTSTAAQRFWQREAKAMKAYEVAACARFDHVVWVSAEDEAAVSGAARAAGSTLRPGSVIPIAVDPDAQQPIPRLEQPWRVTFLGGLHWPPNAAGVMWFVEHVWPAIRAAFPLAVLTAIGKDPPAALSDASVQTMGIEAHGYVSDPTALLAETAVFVVPLLAGGGMRVKILDAWAWELPIVSTSVGAEGIRCTNDHDILVRDAPQTFADAVCMLLANPARAERLARAGRQTVVDLYDWRSGYRAWDDVYPR